MGLNIATSHRDNTSTHAVFLSGNGPLVTVLREALTRDLNQYPGVRRILEQHDDAALHRLMTNLAGNDMQAVLDAFEGVNDDRPTCFIAYTIKGQGLPFAGHKDNHSGLMTLEQMAGFKQGMGIADGQEWEKFAGLAATPGETVPRLSLAGNDPAASRSGRSSVRRRRAA